MRAGLWLVWVSLSLLRPVQAEVSSATEFEKTQATVCGLLEVPETPWPFYLGLTESGGPRPRHFRLQRSFAGGYSLRKQAELWNQALAFTGDRICLNDVEAVWSLGRLFFSPNSSITLDSRFPMKNYSATRCELFIDKAVPVYKTHPSRAGMQTTVDLDVFIKIMPERLFGRATSVRFFGKETWGQLSPGVERAFSLIPFLGASDYYELRLPAHYEWLGSFYVETEKGSRYWLNDRGTPYSPFLLGIELVRPLEEAVGWLGDRPGEERVIDIGTLSKTADAFPALNLRGCR